jgi:hypothetical protein
LSITSTSARLSYVLFNRVPKTWPEVALKARPVLGAYVPFPVISSAMFAIYASGKQFWLKEGDSQTVRIAKSVALGAAAGHASRLFFASNVYYRMVLPAPYLATALPAYDLLRSRQHSVPVSALLAALTGCWSDAVLMRSWQVFRTNLIRRVQTTVPSIQFKSMSEALLWTLMHTTRAAPRALLLVSFDVLLTFIEPFKKQAREDIGDPATTRRRAPSPPTEEELTTAAAALAAAAAAAAVNAKASSSSSSSASAAR